MATQLSVPGKRQTPLSYLGILAFLCFILLGVTGILLQVYYLPDPAGSYNSMERITNQIPYGFELRNLHYWLSNVMVALATGHFFYLYFTRKYLANNEILWVTGIVAGLLTIAEAFTGYSLIMNTRSVEAMNIAIGILTNAQPTLAKLLQGVSLADTIMRMYTLHIVLLPAVLVILFLAHFPRRLVLDVPVVLAMVGGVWITAGLLPADLGSSFSTAQSAGIITPEWYLTGIYALLRTGIDVIIAAVVLPTTFILVFTLAPFIDNARSIGTKQHAVQAALGLTAQAQIPLLTIWGFRAGDLLHPIKTVMDVPIDPTLLYGVLILTSALIFAATLLLRQKLWSKGAPTVTTNNKERTMPYRSTALLISMILILQVALFTNVFNLLPFTMKGLPMIESGLSIVGFAAAIHLYRENSRSRESQ
jgi:ubiquinol-cytochrome c reductase cytochrome b subunit